MLRLYKVFKISFFLLAVVAVAAVVILMTAGNGQSSSVSASSKLNAAEFVSLSTEEQAQVIAEMPASEKLAEEDEGSAYESGFVIARFKENAFNGEELNETGRSAISELVTVVQPDDHEVLKVKDKLALLKVRDGISVSKAVQEISNNSNFESSQANYIYTSVSTPNDSQISNQWVISNANETIDSAWDEVDGTNKVTVAVLDNGIDKDHEDLATNIVEATGVTQKYNEATAKYYTNTDPGDVSSNGHGTHCAGVIGAVSNNSIGIAGMANNVAQIQSIRVFDFQGSSTTPTAVTTDLLNGLYYVQDTMFTYNTKVVSMSLGHEATGNYLDGEVETAISDLKAAGVTVVSASGNDSKSDNMQVPAKFSSGIAVGSTGTSGVRSDFSNYGPELDLVAPGENIYSTRKNSTYGSANGTSCATPYVAAVAALCYSANTSLNATNMYKILTATADRSQGKFTNEYGYGKVNPLNAVKAAKALSDGAASSCAIYFNSNGADNTPVGQVIKSGEKVVIPAAVTKSGSNLEGWYKDEALTTKFDFSQAVTTDLTLWAKWSDVACEHTDCYDINYVAPTCTSLGSKDQICKSCGWQVRTGVTIKMLDHSWVSDNDAVEPIDCSDNTGHYANEHCSVCGTWNSMSGSQWIKAHDLSKAVLKGKKDPTCTEDGQTGYYECGVCGTFLQASATLEKLGHNVEHHEAIAATCKDAGQIEYYHCNREGCGKDLIKNASGEYVEATSLVTQPLGHDALHHERVEPVCGIEGTIEYYECQREGCLLKYTIGEDNQETEVTDLSIPALEHVLQTEVVVEQTCGHGGRLRTYCTRGCGYNETTYTEALEHNPEHREIRNIVEATCVKDSGYTGDTYCTDCGQKLESGIATTDPEKHTTIVNISPRVEPTCSSVGWTGLKYCRGCNTEVQKNEEIAINPDSHDIEHVTAKNATCEVAGYNEHDHCKLCNKDFNRTDYPAFGHTYEEGKCKTCGEKDPNWIDTSSINLTVLNNGSVSFDKDNYVVGDTATLTIKGYASDSILRMPKLVSVDGKEVKSQADLVDKTTWSVVNSEYKRRMGENARSVEYTNVVNSLNKEVQVEVANLQSDTQITVEFEELVPVYRLYNMITSEHLFTTDKTEYNSWVAKSKSDSDYWIGEGINWFAPANSDSQVTRLYNEALGAMGSTSHYYTADAAEINELTTKHGWVNESSSGKTFGSGGNIPIWTCYNEALGSAHHYTSSKTEWQGLQVHGWDLETSKNGSAGVFQAIMSAVS